MRLPGQLECSVAWGVASANRRRIEASSAAEIRKEPAFTRNAVSAPSFALTRPPSPAPTASIVPQSEPFIGGLQERLRSRVSPTFRRGSTGEWREHFTDETEALFRRAAGPVIERYGYPLPADR